MKKNKNNSKKKNQSRILERNYFCLCEVELKYKMKFTKEL